MAAATAQAAPPVPTFQPPNTHIRRCTRARPGPCAPRGGLGLDWGEGGFAQFSKPKEERRKRQTERSQSRPRSPRPAPAPNSPRRVGPRRGLQRANRAEHPGAAARTPHRTRTPHPHRACLHARGPLAKVSPPPPGSQSRAHKVPGRAARPARLGACFPGCRGCLHAPVGPAAPPRPAGRVALGASPQPARVRRDTGVKGRRDEGRSDAGVQVPPEPCGTRAAGKLALPRPCTTRGRVRASFLRPQLPPTTCAGVPVCPPLWWARSHRT